MAQIGFGGGPGINCKLKSWHISMITFGGIIGAELLFGSSTAIHTIGPAAVLSYTIAGFMMLLVMRMISAMVMALPCTQTLAEFAREGAGDWAGFMVAWKLPSRMSGKGIFRSQQTFQSQLTAQSQMICVLN